jgi:hypothetical protein
MQVVIPSVAIVNAITCKSPNNVLNPTTWSIPWRHQKKFKSIEQKYYNNNCSVESPTHDDDQTTIDLHMSKLHVKLNILQFDIKSYILPTQGFA